MFEQSYWKELKTVQWKQKRSKIIERDNSCCRHCGSKDNLHVHHRQYHFYKRWKKFKKPWLYNDNLLITLCSICHDTGHKTYKVQTKYI